MNKNMKKEIDVNDVLPYENHQDGLVALCTLGSINWGKYTHPTEMRKPIRLLVRSLVNILRYQDFLSDHSARHNKWFEPLGIGVTNLAYWHAKRSLTYGSPDALAQVKIWIEHMSFYAIEASNDIAQELGPCEKWESTTYGQGIFPWELRKKEVDELTDFTPSGSLDWEGLRAKLIKYGIRNAVLLALPPVESSSVVINSTNGIEYVKELIISKEAKGKKLIQVAPEYHALKNKYEKLREQRSCENYLKTAAVLQAYVDQGISTNTFDSAKWFKDGMIDITEYIGLIMKAQRWGLKTLYYHIPDKEGAKVNIEDDGQPLVDDDIEHEVCESCVL
jgi:ribonucleoside-diphosphate reductase alpha chain